MKFLVWVILFFSSATGFALEDGLNPCLDGERVKKIMAQFEWSATTDDSGKPIVRKDLCDPEGLFYKVMNALITMEDLPPISLLNEEWGANVVSPSAFEFFQERVQGFHFDRSDLINCKDGTTKAYVYPGEPTVHICPYLAASSTVGIIGTLIHESRHVEGHLHQVCIQGPLIGQNACDPSFEERGAFGVGAEFYVRLSRTEGVDPTVRLEARAKAATTFLNGFNQLPLEIKEGAFAQTEDRKLLFLAEKTVAKVMDEVPAGVLVLRNGLPSWFYAEDAQFVSFTLMGQLEPTDGAFAESFRSTLSATQRFSIKDLYFGDYICRLFERGLQCYVDEKQIFLTLPGKALRFLTFETSIGVQLEDGDIFVLPKDWESIKSYNDISSLSRVHVERPYLSYVWWNGQSSFVLAEDGVLRITKGAEALAHPLEELRGRRFKRVVGPALWSKKLIGL